MPIIETSRQGQVIHWTNLRIDAERTWRSRTSLFLDPTVNGGTLSVQQVTGLIRTRFYEATHALGPGDRVTIADRTFTGSDGR
ncbi:hypothetical protein ACFL2C_03935 [Patescibacteria group bacterium]